MAQTNEPKVNTPSIAWRAMAPRWDLVDCLLGGTETMRAAGERYLPRHREEEPAVYQRRLARTVLLNRTDETLENLTGKVFSEPLQINDDVPAAIAALAEDIDLQGNKLHVFSRAWFREAMAKGFSHVLVEMPALRPAKDGTPRTLADDRAQGVRPYWVHIKPENLIAAYSVVVGGKEVLVHARIAECETVRSGFGEREVRRVRVLEPGTWALWELVDVEKDEWQVVDAGPTGLDVIPLVTYYTARDQFMVCKPPLTDLANLNVAHWQSSSDQRNVLTIARFPILAVSGADSDDVGKLQIGPEKWLSTPDAQGKWYYVEHTGAAISAGQVDLDALEHQMAGYGAQFLKKVTGDQTATARALDTAEAIAPLQAMALNFQDAVSRVLDLTARWLKIDPPAAGEDGNVPPAGGTVALNSNFANDDASVQDLDTLNKARDRRDISRDAYLKELVRRSVLDEDYDAVEDLAAIQDEPDLSLGAAGLFSGTGTGDTPPPKGGPTPPKAPAKTKPGE